MYWEELTDEIGFDLADVFRRRMLVPFVFFPRHVAARHGAPEKTAIYQSLQQAHDAFVFGLPFAALALMRSIKTGLGLALYGGRGVQEDKAEAAKWFQKAAEAGQTQS